MTPLGVHPNSGPLLEKGPGRPESRYGRPGFARGLPTIPQLPQMLGRQKVGYGMVVDGFAEFQAPEF